MFRWLWKPKFYSKCISYVKCIKTRLETIKKRRIAVQNFTKSDIVELLRRGLYDDAYKRVEWLLWEQNMLCCYELIEKFIGCISDHLENLAKQSECPEECKEAVSSLMYAAARISDLPELRHLRILFTKKFGSSLELYTSKELVENLRRDPPTREMKIRLLHDIAQEFSIEWGAKALKQRLNAHLPLYEERPKTDNTDKLVIIGGEHTDGSDHNTSKEKERDTLSLGRKDFNHDLLRNQYSSENETSTDASSNHGRKASSSSFGSISEDEVEIKRPNSFWLIPPPYLKQKTNKGEDRFERTTYSDPKTYDAAKVLDSSGVKVDYGNNAYPSQEQEYDTGQSRTRTVSHVRGTSLPTDPTTSVETSSRGHTRTISLDPQMRGGAWHVHPNFPDDYDDFIARLKALTRRS